jgi:hypothetical protein
LLKLFINLPKGGYNLERDAVSLLLKETGFLGMESVAEAGINSSPLTKGILIRANKPVAF